MGEGKKLLSAGGSSLMAGVLVGSVVATAGGGSGVLLAGSLVGLGTAVGVTLSSAASSGGESEPQLTVSVWARSKNPVAKRINLFMQVILPTL